MKLFTAKKILLLFFAVIFFSCGDDDDFYSPKPKGYYRIKFPEKKYLILNSNCPFTFQVPGYAKVYKDPKHAYENCWFNIEFPKFNSTLHVSYKTINNNFDQYLEDSRTLAVKHQVKASGIEEQIVARDSSKVYGLIYNIDGNTASSLQFHLTDSTKHFLRASLYFNCKPNKDSLAPVLEFIKQDVLKMIETFEWK